MRVSFLATSAALALTLASPAPGLADRVDDIARELARHQKSAETLASGLRPPDTFRSKRSEAAVTKRFSAAALDMHRGAFDEAAVALYDIVEKHRDHPRWEYALYYLGESLYRRGDYMGARSTFSRLVREVPKTTPFLWVSLERLLDLTFKLEDSTGVEEWLAVLDSAPPNVAEDTVPYVRGKFAYFQGNYDEALKRFKQLKPKSRYYFQAHYFAATTFLARSQLAKAADVLHKLTGLEPRSASDARVLELANLALGRIYYQRNHAARAVEHYLLIPRTSNHYATSLQELAWAYVKDRRFDRALTSLILLSTINDAAGKTPTVRLLEGNLRVRKGQAMSRIADAAKEYEVAAAVFDKLKLDLDGPRSELAQIIASGPAPSVFVPQLTGKPSAEGVPQLSSTLLAWLKTVPEVKRARSIYADLDQIRHDLEETANMIERLERILDSPSRIRTFPGLAKKKVAGRQLIEDVYFLRIELADLERGFVAQYASPEQGQQLAQLAAERKRIIDELKALPGSDLPVAERVQRARARYIAVDQELSKVNSSVQSTYAQLRSLKMYLNSEAIERIDSKNLQTLRNAVAAAENEINELSEDVAAAQRDLVVARDLAGIGDPDAERTQELLARLREALDSESEVLGKVLENAQGGDRTKGARVHALVTTANQISASLLRTSRKIDEIVDQALVDTRSALEEEKARVAAYFDERAQYVVAAEGLGGEVLAIGFDHTAAEFDSILIRADAGLVDIAWSLRESADRLSKRLNLNYARERKNLDTEFTDVLQESRPLPEPEEGGAE